MPLPLRRLQQQLKRALTFLPRPLPEQLEKIEIVLVNSATMTRVHADFLNDPTVTDVITFPYGEILVCPTVAQTQAKQHGHPTEVEVLLYALHGILHLAGYDDTTKKAAAEMAATQEQWLKKALAGKK